MKNGALNKWRQVLSFFLFQSSLGKEVTLFQRTDQRLIRRWYPSIALLFHYLENPEEIQRFGRGIYETLVQKSEITREFPHNFV